MTYLNTKAIEHVESYIKKEMEWMCSAHDFFHIQRVMKLATKLQGIEWKWDLTAIIIWAYMHESLDDKFFWEDNMQSRKNSIKSFLQSLDLSEEQVENILFIISNVWYGKSLERDENFVWSIEFQIVEDADRLEAIWAIAIARCFAYGWKKKRAIYDPDIKPQTDLDRKQYAKWENTSINHFYEKLLLLKDLMHTDSWRALAQERHVYMEDYLKRFFEEWNI